jgi:hypothetical protein
MICSIRASRIHLAYCCGSGIRSMTRGRLPGTMLRMGATADLSSRRLRTIRAQVKVFLLSLSRQISCCSARRPCCFCAGGAGGDIHNKFIRTGKGYKYIFGQRKKRERGEREKGTSTFFARKNPTSIQPSHSHRSDAKNVRTHSVALASAMASDATAI